MDNTYTNLSAEQKTFYERALLGRLVPSLVYCKYGQKKSAPKHEGDKVSFRRFNAISPKTTPLSEGVTPQSSALDITKVDATVAQYGDFVRITDKLDMLGIDPVLTETAQVLGESAALTLDTIARDVVNAGTNVQYAGAKSGRSALGAADKLTAEEVRKAVRTLRRNHAKPADGKYYIGIIDADAAFDLMSDPLWQDVSKYSGGTALMDGELGKLHGVRFVENGNPATFNGTSITVHSTLILGKDAFGTVDIEGVGSVQNIVKPLGSAGTDDPLNQRASSGWKALFTAVRLQELAMLRIEHSVSA
ncbi:N4-gp56 family major capsid protein [Ruminococcaceae bacterium OttesenSCG-928-N02]|nr:N4-gp56 family major capsid protein [Ruminococcaceae bacterium OttesenSCG-928-N02]